MNTLQDTPLSDVPIVVVDTETTGLSPALGHRVVEVAAVRMQGWQEVQSFDQLVNPGRPMDPGASRVNGIYDEDLQDAAPFSSVAGPLSSLMDGALVVAHNASFDAGFLSLEYGLLEEHRRPDSPWLCTLRLARSFFHFGNNRLTNVARALNVRSGRSHRALSDAYTTARVLKKMASRLQQWQLHTVGDLLHAQGGPIYIPKPATPPLPAPMASALREHRAVRIHYVSGRRETRRVIRPLYATEERGNTYLVAYCHLRQAQRTFRLDRIAQAELLDGEA